MKKLIFISILLSSCKTTYITMTSELNNAHSDISFYENRGYKLKGFSVLNDSSLYIIMRK